MNFSASDFVTVNEILSNVTLFVDDEEMTDFNHGFYTSQIQKALQELSFDTFFHKITEEFEMPQDLRLPMPKGAFNVKQIYLFNGTKCNIGTNTQNVYHKRNYFTGGNGWIAKDKGGSNSNDPFYFRSNTGRRARSSDTHDLRGSNNVGSSVCFYEIQGGMIMFSSNCLTFEKVMLVYNGVHTNIGDEPVVPTYLREAVEDYVTETVLRIRSARDPLRWRLLWSDAVRKLGKSEDSISGSWITASRRVKNIDAKQREDLFEYMSRLNY